jgi:hypothetical protein
VAATSDQQTAPILRAVLDALRARLLKKLSGLSEEDARRSTVDSGTNLAGLLQHLTYVESKWFEENVAGGKGKGSIPRSRCRACGRIAALRARPATYPAELSATRRTAGRDCDVGVSR